MYPTDIPPNDEEREEKLPEDNDSPATSAGSDTSSENAQTTSQLGTTHPAKDTDLDATEAYDAGMDVASGVTPPQDSSVVDYHPEDDAPEE
jgi:hypothetical protein